MNTIDERKFKIGDPILEVNNISLSFGGVNAITDTSFNVLEHEVRAIIGPNGDFSSLPNISKWILSLGMILGRLELFAILVLFLPSFWRS